MTTKIKDNNIFDFQTSEILIAYVGDMVAKWYDGSAITGLSKASIDAIVHIWNNDSTKSPLVLTVDYNTGKLGLTFYSEMSQEYKDSVTFYQHYNFDASKHPDAPKVIAETTPPDEITTTDGVKIYKTTEDNIIVQQGNKFMFLDNAWDKFTSTPDSHGAPSAALRKDSALYKKIINSIWVVAKKQSELSKVNSLKWFDVLMNKETFEIFIDINNELIPIDASGIDRMKKEFEKFEKVKTSLVPVMGSYKLSDRVMLYWPTGTWKTYDFLSHTLAMKAAGTLDEIDIVTITDGMEDMDFLAHILPTWKGIEYKENKVVTLLREASNGKKVAILLDELNRGSKSFLNLILKLLDPVDGKTYTLNNFIKNESIVIPIENVLFFAAMNLGGKYTGTNALDEALLDRFNVVQYKGYNLSVEKDISKSFAPFASQAIDLTKQIRQLHKDGEIRVPISTRWVKMWAESFLTTWKTKEELFETFKNTILYRLISVDDSGNPNTEEIAIIMKKFKDLGIIS